MYGGRVYFPWTGKVLVRGSLSKIIAMEDAIKKWIGVRDEMLKGGLSGGQMLVKLTEELTNAKDKLIEVITGKKVIKPKVIPEVNTGCAVEKTKTIRIMPRRDCRHKAYQAWINGVHVISDDRLRRCNRHCNE